ncbi:MAG: hypothetical protein KA248_09700 [Kiritimatiellae bacterium]|nr:hypothetical protein [Kiritimatiellia bacterium]
MKKQSLMVAVLVATTTALASETQIQGGQLWVNGEWQADGVTVAAPAALGGAGTVRSPQTTVTGTLAPGAAPGAVGALAFAGDLEFEPGGKYACDVSGAESLDRAVVQGAAAGSGGVEVSNPGGFIPVDQVIVDAANATDYAGFTADAGWGLRELPIEDLALTSLNGDTDSDGQPDWYELAYTGSRTALDPDAHNDDDDVPNLDEYRAGTDPTDGASYLRVTRLQSMDGGKLRLAWPSVASRWLNVAAPLYELSASGSLRTGEFAAVAGNLPSTPPENFHTNAPAGDFQVWRVRRQ